MKLTFRRRSERIAEGGVADGMEAIELTRGSVWKLITLLAGSTTLGTFLTFLISFALRDLPAARGERAIRERCLQVQVAAVAVQADSLEERKAGLRLLLALGSLSDEGRRVESLLSSTTTIPQWSSVAALASACASQGSRSLAEASTAVGDSASSVGNASDKAMTSSRVPESTTARP